MAKLRLWISDTDRTVEFDASEVTVGREPTLDIVASGPDAGVVSTRHARVFYGDGSWWVEDLGSSNGTYIKDVRLEPRTPGKIVPGDILRLGRAGIRIRVEAPPVAATMMEPSIDRKLDEATLKMDGIPAPTPPPREKVGFTGEFLEMRTGQTYQVSGDRVRIGRGRECELRPVKHDDTSVSRVHTEIALKPDGTCTIRDAQSRNGTIVNGKTLKGERQLVEGDIVTLGNAGPRLKLVKLTLPTARKSQPDRGAGPGASGRRSFGGQGATQYIKNLVQEAERRSSAKTRWVMWSLVVVVAAGLGGGYWYANQRVSETVRALEEQRQEMVAQRALSDSLGQAAAAEMERLRAQLGQARTASAPSAMLDSLRAELAAATERTAVLEASFRRAQEALARQMAAGDSLRREAEQELRRLRGQLSSASSGGVSQAQVDSLLAAVAAAEQQVNDMSSRMRAVRGVDLAAIAQANQGAVGLVTSFQGRDVYDGSGFMLTRSGYFVTNRHVVQPGGRPADSIYVVMADNRYMHRVEVVRVAPPNGPDVAVIRYPNYNGPVVHAVDWTGTRARQGEPAALIGLPAGSRLAVDATQTVRTSMSAGIFSKIEPTQIQFDGFTIGGSSGSPVFNGNGEVVAIHYAGLAEATGLGFAVPIQLLPEYLPGEVKAEFGLR